MTMMRSSIFLMAIGFGLLCSTAGAAAELPAACRAKIDARLPGWQLKLPSDEVAAFAREEKFDPALVQGDFDDDGLRDTAVLVTAGAGSTLTAQIAVCMSRKAGPELHIIRDPYCRDGISLTRKGSAGFNFETDKEIKYRTDGVHTFCFEKAGATYLYRGGRFIRIIDSD